VSLLDNAANGLNIDIITPTDSGLVGSRAFVIDENCQTTAPEGYLMTLLKGVGVVEGKEKSDGLTQICERLCCFCFGTTGLELLSFSPLTMTS
jgi:hypothetical protein